MNDDLMEYNKKMYSNFESSKELYMFDHDLYEIFMNYCDGI